MSNYPRFGKNYAKLVEFRAIPAQSGKSAAALIKVNVEGKDFYSYVNEPEQSFTAGGKQINLTDEKFKAAKKDAADTLMHVAQAFLSKEEVVKLISQDKAKAKEQGHSYEFYNFAKTIEQALPMNYQEKGLEVFLQWQWKARKGYERTFLELPSSVKHGPFMVPYQGKGYKWNLKNLEGLDYKEINKIKIALSYVNEQGEVHPFTRSGWFMNSNYAQKQGTQTVEQPSKEEIEADAAYDPDDLPF